MNADVEKRKYTKPEGSKTWEYLVCFTSMIMSNAIGCVHGWNSPSIVALMAPDSPIPITASDAGTLVALVSIGFMIATPFGMYLLDKIGRKKVLLMSALPMILGWCLIMIVMNIWVLYVARLLNGIAIGIFFHSMPIYIAENVSPCLRGFGQTLNMLSYNAGILLAYMIMPYMSIPMSSAIFMGITIVYFIILCFMPESPYYLAMKNRTEDVEEVLEKLRGRTDVSEEMELVFETVKFNNQQRTGGFRKLLTVRANRRAFLINNALQCCLNFGGYYTIIAYVQLIFKSQTNVVSDHITTIVLGVTQVIAMLITTFIIDRLNRKSLLLTSSIAVATANLVIAMFFYAKDFLYIDVSAYSLVLFVAMIVLMFANCGVVSLYLTVESEIFAIDIKTLACCLGGITNAVCNIIAAKTYILITVTWGYGPMPVFLSYFVTVVICTIVILNLMPETKGKTFVQIQKELSDRRANRCFFRLFAARRESFIGHRERPYCPS